MDYELVDDDELDEFERDLGCVRCDDCTGMLMFFVSITFVMSYSAVCEANERQYACSRDVVVPVVGAYGALLLGYCAASEAYKSALRRKWSTNAGAALRRTIVESSAERRAVLAFKLPVSDPEDMRAYLSLVEGLKWEERRLEF